MKHVHIWDPFIRLFHWALVAGFVANALIIDADSTAHEWLGYAVLGLVALRLVWGGLGPRSACLQRFLPPREAVIQQITDIATRRRRAHLGHSPLGALMIVNLLASMLAIGLTGWMMTTHAFWGVGWVEDIHEALVTWAWLSVALHVAAVLWESLRTGINLPRAMVTGSKRVPDGVKLLE